MCFYTQSPAPGVALHQVKTLCSFKIISLVFYFIGQFESEEADRKSGGAVLLESNQQHCSHVATRCSETLFCYEERCCWSLRQCYVGFWDFTPCCCVLHQYFNLNFNLVRCGSFFKSHPRADCSSWARSWNTEKVSLRVKISVNKCVLLLNYTNFVCVMTCRLWV